MEKAVLAINSGSSSIKFALYKLDNDIDPSLTCKGMLDKHASSTHFTIKDAVGKVVDDGQSGADKNDDLIVTLLDRLKPMLGDTELTAVGHRIVHGGPDFYDPVVISDEVLKALEKVTPLAPLHQPACLSPIQTLLSTRPKLTQVACFDTAFHRDLAPVYREFPVPKLQNGLHRYGFHGLSFEYISQCLDEPHLKTVVAHLGSGASLCALTHGKSFNTTMSLTPLDGLVMATRSGSLDPGLLLYLQKSGRCSLGELEDMLYHKSGLLALSGSSGDMRELLNSDDSKAKQAVEQFCARTAEQIAVMATSLRGLDRLVFTGGIGEHSAEVRLCISEQLRWLGLELDTAANNQARRTISARNSRVAIEVIPTNEELMIVEHTIGIGLRLTR